MGVIGVIAEYNPFHHGHAWQLRELRRRFPSADGIIVVMSGSITQRGTPAVLDKWTRAGHAVDGGADLVLELPFAFACRSAQDFARGGVSLLMQLGVVSHLAFGTEAADIDPLERAAREIDTEKIQHWIAQGLSMGLSYAAALSSALAEQLDIEESILRTPNNILGVEYLRALHAKDADIMPLALPRKTAEHGEARLRSGITSASSIRTALGQNVPPWEHIAACVMPNVLGDLRSAHPHALPSQGELLRLLRYELLTMSDTELRSIYGIAEGIENRLMRALRMAETYEDLLTLVSTKRYPKSRIGRLAIHLLLRLQKAQAEEFDHAGCLYIRPLVFNGRGKILLRRIKKISPLPVITRTAEVLSSDVRAHSPATLSLLQQMLSFDTRATELRTLTRPQQHGSACGTDFLSSPIYHE
ncbi:nucleotidyltransferase family protein [uncultured Selenomonas sp.]|uniref:tRNA(Met) cytidine acetate ligase n=1 Tax=uncultured Selenomonas sp. TaxID=159275 RepID=UPI0028EC28A7|nr:nucleotidyltransferase family protein [uncultured Selenomonas sp.]